MKTQLAALGLSSKVAELPTEVSLAAIEAAQAPDRFLIYNSHASAASQHYLKQVRDFQQHAEQDPYPNVFFINMTCSGGSAIAPVLSSIVASRWYFLPPFGPEGSSLIDFFPHQPFCHWSHSCVSQFSQYLQRPDCKFIFMHRDPAVSIANDYFGRLGEPAFSAMLQLIVSCYLKPPVTIALEWLRQQCLVITFDEMKASPPAVVRRILNHCGIDDVTDEEIEQHAAAHSFERMTGRQRGEEGNAIRTGYFWRKGVSGDWRNHFDPRLTDEFKYLYGDALLALHYETDLDWRLTQPAKL